MATFYHYKINTAELPRCRATPHGNFAMTSAKRFPPGPNDYVRKSNLLKKVKLEDV